MVEVVSQHTDLQRSEVRQTVAWDDKVVGQLNPHRPVQGSWYLTDPTLQEHRQ